MACQIALTETAQIPAGWGFAKYHGLGNDFVVLDLRGQRWCPDRTWFQKYANRRCGVGFDQALLVLDTACLPEVSLPEGKALERVPQVGYAIVNADGQWVSQCGNGARCVADWLMQHPSWSGGRAVYLRTTSGLMHVELSAPGLYTVQMGAVVDGLNSEGACHQITTLETPEGVLKCMCLFIGNPHVVLQVPSIDSIDLQSIGVSCQKLLPEGVNVSCVEVGTADSIRLRVYERGVGETHSCASGACCAVVAAHRWSHVEQTAHVNMQGGCLTVIWDDVHKKVTQVGPVCPVYTGQFVS